VGAFIRGGMSTEAYAAAQAAAAIAAAAADAQTRANNAQAAAIAADIGVGQTWQDVTATRAVGSIYTNTTGRPIAVSVVMANTLAASSFTALFYVNGVLVEQEYDVAANGVGYTGASVGAIVPNGASYQAAGMQASLIGWRELR